MENQNPQPPAIENPITEHPTAPVPKSDGKLKISIKTLIASTVVGIIIISTVAGFLYKDRIIQLLTDNPAEAVNESAIGNFPIYSGAVFVKKILRQNCTTDEIESQPQESGCFNDTYQYSVPEKLSSVHAWYMNDTHDGWSCNGGAGEIDDDANIGNVITSCSNSNQTYFLRNTSEGNETTISVIVPKSD